MPEAQTFEFKRRAFVRGVLTRLILLSHSPFHRSGRLAAIVDELLFTYVALFREAAPLQLVRDC